MRGLLLQKNCISTIKVGFLAPKVKSSKFVKQHVLPLNETTNIHCQLNINRLPSQGNEQK